MKKIIAIVASLAIAAVCSAPVFAQDANVDSKAVVTNSLGSNWFVQGGLGLNVGATIGGAGSGVGLGLAGDLGVGKWIDPQFGVRLMESGVTSGFGKDANGDQMKSTFGILHGDFMWNVSNTRRGYDPERCYSFIPYVSMGLLHSAGLEFAAGAGIDNKFRLNDKWDLDVDIRGMVSHPTDFNSELAGRFGAVTTATVGVTYNFGKATTWTTAGAVAAAAAAAAAKDALAKAAAEKEASDKEAAAKHAAEVAKLQKDLADAQANTGSTDDEVIAKMLKNVPATVHFEIGQAKLSNKELEHFDFYAKNLVAGSSDLKFVITSSADKATGSAKRNKQLMQMRGDYVSNLLTDKYGVDASKITIVSDTEDLYTGRGELGRVSVITVAE